MLNNLLKVVGVEKDSSPSSPGGSSNNHSDATLLSAGDGIGATAAASSIKTPSRYQPTRENKNDNNNLNLASTIGGFLNSFQGTRIVADALDSTIVSGHNSWKGSTSGNGIGGAISGGRSSNVGGRGYYSEGSTSGSRNRRRGEPSQVPQQFPASMASSSSSSSVGGNYHSQRGTKNSNKGKRPSSSTVGKKKTSANTISNSSTYMGRKMVSDISHLYQVVDDKEAYENYDELMEVTRNVREQALERLSYLGEGSDSEKNGSKSDGGSRRSNSSHRRHKHRRDKKSSISSRDVSNQEEKQNWARMKEEELIDRMLSQFPEFGTNRPTPFIVMEEDDNPNDGNNNDDNSLLQSHHHGITGDMSSNNKIGNNNSSAGVAAGQKSKKNGSSLNTNFSNTQTAATNFPYSPSQFFTEDASIIGRFFSGMTGGDATTTGAASAKNCKIPNAATAPEGFQRTASFGSTSTMSTVTTTTGQSGLDRSLSSRKSGNVLSGIPLQKGDIHSSTFDAALVAGEVNDIGKEQVTWDQDEIDLWNSCSNNITPELSTKISASIPGTVSYADDRSGLGEGKEDHQQQVNSGNVCEEETDNNNWAIRRRRHHEWRKKQRQDWDALAQGAISRLPPLPTDPITVMLDRGFSSVDRPVISVSNNDQLFHHIPQLQPNRNGEVPSHESAVKQQHQRRSNAPKREGKDGGPSGGSVIVDDGKQHWMPDNLCKICYSCEAPFTLLRRKHHCRVCGMIFCSACSAYFVQISSTNDWSGSAGGGETGTSSPDKNNAKSTNAGTMRTCKMCYDHLSERGLGVIVRGDSGTTTKDSTKKLGGAANSDLQTPLVEMKKQPSSSLAEMTTSSGPFAHQGSSALNILLPLATTTAGSKLAPSSQDKNMTPEGNSPIPTGSATTNMELAEQFASSFQGGSKGAMLSSGDFRALSITKQRLDEERRRREEQERLDAEAAARLEEKILAEKEEAEKARGGAGGSGGGPSLFRRKSRLIGGRQLKWKTSPSNPEANASSAEETIKAGSNGVEVSVGGNGIAAVGEPGGGSDSQGPLSESLQQNAEGDAVPSVPSSLLENSSGIEEALAFGPRSQSKDAKLSAKIHLGMVAADYLEKLGRELLHTDAPLLLEEIKKKASMAASLKSSASAAIIESELTDLWVNTLMTLATRCCATVEPDVKNGDLLDIRPYCKLKVIPGGSVEDSAYLSGVVFHKNVSHKKMARVIPNAKIMILSGGIEYTRTENRIASLDALLEQEERYMEILVTKIFKLHPDVLITGKSVCRKAQELLLRANIVLIQYTKTKLMKMIARQTGATVLSSIDHVMNSTILGYCRRFRLVSFRDNDEWVDTDIASSEVSSSDKKSVAALLSKPSAKYFERQAALAARKLGEGVLDGMDAVTLGLAKRGVVKTYIMIEGCPKELGCTVILRGASRPALKMVKRVLRFLINCSYNMKLETSYILERCCRLPPSYKIPPTPCCSSSLCVDFGQPPNNRRNARPWNGGKHDPAQRSLSGKITPLDQQAILITSVWMTETTQCCPAEVKGICYYSQQDVSLGQFLRDSCFNLSLKCQNPSCKKSVLDHSLSFIHNDGLINITVERLDNPIPTSSLQQKPIDVESLMSAPRQESPPTHSESIATWTYCQKCSQVVTPLTFLSKQTWQWSFGKFLEVYFYNRDAIINAPGHCCSCRMQTSSQLFFGCGDLAARFTYERINPYSVFCRRHLPFDEHFHRNHSLQDLEHISTTSSSLFVKYDKQIETISRETRELFVSATNKPEHLQAVLSELNLVSAEVGNASKVLQEKISSVTAKFSKTDSGKRADLWSDNDALFNFPWYSRRYLFMLASAWNERLSAAGNVLAAMKKIQHAGTSGRGDSTVVPVIVGHASTEDVIEGMKQIRLLQETYSRNYNVAKMTMPQSNKEEGDLFEGNILPDGRVATLEQEAEIEDEEFYSDHENEIDFEDDIDADVLASRNRVYSPRMSSSSKRTSRQRPKKVMGGKRPDMAEEPDQSSTSLGFANNYDSSGQLESQGKIKTVTAGGAVKSALTRFFNRGGNKEDPYVVDLGFFGQGRPRLARGMGGLVIPVFDDQPSTIIAHSLASSDYDVQFKQFLNATSQSEPRSDKYEPTRKDIERRMLGRNKSHIKHTFRDFDEKGQQLCKFVCTTFWSVQFNSVRSAFMSPQSSGDSSVSAKSSGVNRIDIEKSYIRSLATSFAWAASGGKSGAAFSRTTDDRFVIKCISRTELQMFLDCAPAYFEYLSKAFFHGLPTVLCKIVGVYQIGYHNRVTGRRTMEQVAVMQNIFYGRKISKVFDLKGSLRGRFTRQGNSEKEKKAGKHSAHYRRSKSDATSDSDSFLSGDEDDDSTSTSSGGTEKDEKITSNAEKGEKSEKSPSSATLLDGDFLEFTSGRPLPLTDRAKAVFHMSILNDTLFLSIINVLDYSILVGIDEEKMELVVGIIDFMRQYDILKQMERVGKSLPMVVGSEAPTIIQPPLYKQRFTNAMERYFMTVPSKWTTI